MQREITQEFRIVLIGQKVTIEHIETENPTADEAARGNKSRVRLMGKLTARQAAAWGLMDKLAVAKAQADKQETQVASSTNEAVDPTKTTKFKDAPHIEAAPRIGKEVVTSSEPKASEKTPEVVPPAANPAPADPPPDPPPDPPQPGTPAPKKRGRPRKVQ